jgi:hypothetical protein
LDEFDGCQPLRETIGFSGIIESSSDGFDDALKFLLPVEGHVLTRHVSMYSLYRIRIFGALEICSDIRYPAV